MAFYNTCPLCGANLDPGEKCDCKNKMEEKTSKPNFYTEVEPLTKQLKMILRREHEEITAI